MSIFSESVIAAAPGRGETAVFWLGQAGFLFKTEEGRLIAVDPYLSDCCQRYAGFKRLLPRLFQPYDLAFDALIATHAHYDHLDIDALPMLLEGGRTAFFGALDTKPECEKLKLTQNIHYISVGDLFYAAGARITATECDHGELAPDAVGLLIETGGRRIYIMGDTCYRPDLLDGELYEGLDLLILPINGAFGNLNEEQAAAVAKTLRPRLTVPCHFWNFAEHGGDPARFAAAMADGPAFRVMRPGECIII